jgi:hypothetical protein
VPYQPGVRGTWYQPSSPGPQRLTWRGTQQIQVRRSIGHLDISFINGEGVDLPLQILLRPSLQLIHRRHGNPGSTPHQPDSLSQEILKRTSNSISDFVSLDVFPHSDYLSSTLMAHY